MPYRICKTIDIENGHMLSKHPDKCRFPHGHTRKVEFLLEADQLDENDMVCDFKLIRQLIDDYLDRLDHALCVNSQDPAFSELQQRYGERIIAFDQEDPTTEVMARTIFVECQRRLREYATEAHPLYALRADVRLVSVKVWETTSSWAEFS